jgi:hypothetical protein
VCISVIDESSPTATTIRNDWLSFRSNHPNRDFWLLQPGRTAPELKAPAEFTSDPKANGPVQVARDGGNTSLRSDWFVICNLSSYAPGTIISLAIDTSGSMTLSTVRASYDLFKQKCAQAGLVIVESPFGSERWAVPHNRNFSSSVSNATCISVIDESSPTATTIRNDWLSFRSNFPTRIFWILQPGRTKSELKIPSEYEADSRANYSQVARDNGNTSLRSDLFVICNLQVLKPGSVISLAIDNSGSMTLSTVRASYDLFKQKCAQAGLVIVESTIGGDERWAVPHNVALPEPESTTVGISTVRVSVSNPSAQTLISNNADLNVISIFSREIINFELVSDTGLFFDSGSINLFNNITTFTSDPNNVTRSLTIYPPEKDIRVRITLAAGAGAPRGARGGEGGLSVFECTFKQNIEYVFKLGAATSPTGGTNGGGGGAYLYEKARLIAVCGGGGGSGTSGRGGDGGGIGVGGEFGLGRSSGAGGRVVTAGNLPTSSGALASGTLGGRVSGCTIGKYYRNIGFLPCQDVGQEKWRGANGNITTQTAVIQRGYKSGLSYRNNGGNGTGNQGGGGSGAYGGNAATSGGSGGGGGSGYTDGSIVLLSTRLGGNSSTNAFAVIEFLT